MRKLISTAILTLSILAPATAQAATYNGVEIPEADPGSVTLCDRWCVVIDNATAEIVTAPAPVETTIIPAVTLVRAAAPVYRTGYMIREF